MILAKTGCRISEALEVEMGDLMLENSHICLRKRKGGTQTVVPLDDETVKSIKRLLMIRSNDDSDSLFLSLRGARVSRDRIRLAIREAAVKCGIMELGETRFYQKFTPHTFRTVFTTLMRQQGMDDRVLQYIRGDAVSKTMDVYTRVDRDEVKRQYRGCMKSLDL